MKFEDKVVLVSGGGEGIGKCISGKYAREGAKVIILDINEEAGFRNEKYIFENGGKAEFIRIDIASENECRKAVEKIAGKYKKIDILINNAGIAKAETGGIFSVGMEDFDRVINVNLIGDFMLTKFSVPYMEKGSSIVNISSTRAFMSEKNTEAYSASKGGIISLTHAMAVSLAEKNIRVNSIAPGWIDVSEWKNSTDKAEEMGKLTEADHKQHPAGRVGVPEDIAEACMFLTSEEAGFITGTNLTVDGGMTVKMIYI